MDTDCEILGIGVLMGWIITAVSGGIVGMVMGVAETTMVITLGVSTGVLVGIILMGLLVYFLSRFEIVRRE